MKRHTNIDPATLREVLQSLNTQQGFADDFARMGASYDPDIQEAYVDGLQRMLDAIITDNYTDISKHVYFDGRDRKWYVEGVQL